MGKLLKSRRKKLIIMPKIQYGIMGYFAILALAIYLAQLGSIYLFMRQLDDAATTDQRVRQMADVLFEFKGLLLTYQLIPTLGVSIVGLFLFRKLSNRITGPIYRIYQTVRQYNQSGTCQPIVLRKDDFFHELSVEINTITQPKN